MKKGVELAETHVHLNDVFYGCHLFCRQRDAFLWTLELPKTRKLTGFMWQLIVAGECPNSLYAGRDCIEKLVSKLGEVADRNIAENGQDHAFNWTATVAENVLAGLKRQRANSGLPKDVSCGK